MSKPSDKILQTGVIRKFPPEEEDESGDLFNEVEITHADVALNTDRTIVVRMHSVDLTTKELLKLAREQYDKMRVVRNAR